MTRPNASARGAGTYFNFRTEVRSYVNSALLTLRASMPGNPIGVSYSARSWPAVSDRNPLGGLPITSFVAERPKAIAGKAPRL